MHSLLRIWLMTAALITNSATAVLADSVTASQEWKDLVAEGDAQAQFNLGLMYDLAHIIHDSHRV